MFRRALNPNRPSLPWRCLLAALWVIVVLSSGTVRADEATEAKVKSAFVPHLIGFVTWPDSAFENARAPIRVGILGDFPLLPETEAAMAQQRIHGRALIIEQLAGASSATNCQVVLVGRSAAAQVPALTAQLAGQPVLTLGDLEDFSAHGGLMNFLLDDGKVRFKVNLTVAKQAGLTISSRLLQVASVIREPADTRRGR